MKSVLSLFTLVLFCMVLTGCVGTQNTDNGSTQSSGINPSVSATISTMSIEEQYAAFEQPCYDEKNQRECKAPSDFSQLIFDPSFMQTMPHSFLLVAGKDQQTSLLAYIQRANVSPEKKNEWSSFMMEMWMKYPVMYVENGNSAKLVQGKTTYPYTLTSDENTMFQEIERYIAEDTENVSSNNAR